MLTTCSLVYAKETVLDDIYNSVTKLPNFESMYDCKSDSHFVVFGHIELKRCKMVKADN